MSGAGDERFWNIIAVFDPDGGGSDFAYTVGLAERGLPELHIWARPTHGDDPGADWYLSRRDLGHVLNDCAERAVAGSLGVGSTWSEQFDGGHTRADFVAGELVDRLDVDAFKVADGVRVLPIRWSLHRPPVGALGPLDEATERAARSALDQIVRRVDSGAEARLPTRWRPVRDASFDPLQPYGPLTSLVVAAGAEIATASTASITTFCHAILDLIHSHGHRYGDVLINVEARQVGRAAAVEAARAAAGEISRIVVGRETRPTYRWRQVINSLFGDTTGAERRSLAHGMAHCFEDTVATYLAVHVIGDVATEETRRAGFGPWYWGRRSSMTAPGPLWWAPADVLDRVADAVGPLDAARLIEIGLCLGSARVERIGDDDRIAYEDHVTRLRGMALTQPIGMPAPMPWLDGTKAGAELGQLALATGGNYPVPLIVEALALITSAVAAAEIGIDHDLDDVLAPFEHLVPSLLPMVATTA